MVRVMVRFRYLESEDNDEEESVCCKKNLILLKSTTVAKEGDDEDKSTNSYQDEGCVGQERRFLIINNKSHTWVSKYYPTSITSSAGVPD